MARQEQLATTSRFVLRNGITVVISELHAAPIVAAVAYFKPGASDAPGASILRRLLAKVVVRGTVLRPGERVVEDLRRLGALAETRTSKDGTAFGMLVPPEKIEDALAIQADMLEHPSLDAETMRREMPSALEDEGSPFSAAPSLLISSRINGVCEPLDRGLAQLNDLDDPASYSAARVVSLAIPSEAPPSLDALKGLARDDLVEFYRASYRPENLIISIAGDVSTFPVLVAIQRLYGAFGAVAEPAGPKKQVTPAVTTKKAEASKPTPDAQRGTKPEIGPEESTSNVQAPAQAQDRLRYQAERADISQSIVSVGFRVSGADSRETAAMEVLAALLGIGRASRLSRTLIDETLAANRIRADFLRFNSDGVLRIQMWMATESREGAALDKAESGLFKELVRLRAEPPTESELARTKLMLEKRFIDETAGYLGRANALALAEAKGTGFRTVLDYPSYIGSVRPEDVQRVAAKYLTLKNTAVHEYEPVGATARTFDSETFAATVKAWAPTFDPPAENASGSQPDTRSATTGMPQGSERSAAQRVTQESLQPLPLKDFSTLNGPKAFVCEDHSQPNVTIGIFFQGGRLIEDSATSGTTELMLRSVLYGTPRRTFSQLNEELDGLGADVQIVVEPDFCGFVLSVLSRNADRALKLLRDAIEEPAFRDDDVARARLAQIASIREARDSSISRSHELMSQALFPGHSYSLPLHGREEVISKLTGEKLTEWHTRVIKRQLPIAIIVGDTAGSALVSSQLAEGFRRREPETSIQVRNPRPDAAGEKAESRRRERTTIALGFPGPKADSSDQVALRLIEWAFNGEGGLLQRELQNKQSIVSSAALDDQSMFAAGVISAFAMTSPESEQKARAALMAELGRIAHSGLEADELSSARALAITFRRACLQDQRQHTLEYARSFFYKKAAADADAFVEQASKVTADDTRRVASTYFKVSTAFAGVVRGTPSQAIPSAPPKRD